MKILLAYDGFEHSRHALEEAANIAKDEGGTITIVSVVPPTARATKSGGHSGLPPHAEDDVTRAQEFIRERGIEADTKILNGDPADLLIGEAAEGGYDVAVVGSRGLGTVAGLFLGSVSRKLVKHMPCPVIVAGPDKVERHEPALAAKR
jgi:nucleotide-binding universal stress UspA family protein